MHMSSPEASFPGLMNPPTPAHDSASVAAAPFLRLIHLQDDASIPPLGCWSVAVNSSDATATSANLPAQFTTHPDNFLCNTALTEKGRGDSPHDVESSRTTVVESESVQKSEDDAFSLGSVSSTTSSNCQVSKQQFFLRPPHLSLSRDAIIQEFKHKSLYIFLDYDGTLTPIVPNPCDAVLSPRVRGLLYSLANSAHITVGIVTGRALASVKHFVQITATEQLNFIYAASHGFHIEAAGRKIHHRVGSHFIPILKAASFRVASCLGHIPGVVLEDNEFAVSVHYRNTPENSEAEVEKLLDNVLYCFPALKKTRGKKVFELRINVDWNKGRAVEWLLQSMNVDPYNPENRIVYIGDDLTDEDAFHVVRQFDHGLAVLVSETPENRSTAATCYLSGPDQVADFLEDLLHVASPNPV